MKKIIILMMSLLFLLTACGEVQDDNKIRVFADSSLEAPLKEAVNLYNEENPIDIELITDSSEKLCSRIENGANCDIFIPSSNTVLDTLVNEGLVDKGSVIPLFTNEIAVVTGFNYGGRDFKTNVISFDSIPKAKDISLVSEKDSAGMFSREIFINLNVFEQVLSMKTSTFEDSPSVAKAIAENNTEIGVCYETDALMYADKVRVIALAPKESLNSDLIYSSCVVKGDNDTTQSDSVFDFNNFLDSPEVAEIFSEYDFGIYMQ